MKKILLYTTIILVGYACNQPKNDRTIAWNQPVINTAIKPNTKAWGTILNKQTPWVALIAEGLRDTVQTSQDGHFAIQLPLAEAGYFLLKSDRASLRIFLQPGDNLEITFDQQDIFNTVEFKGKGSKPNST
jgi:hypothetical protein